MSALDNHLAHSIYCGVWESHRNDDGDMQSGPCSCDLDTAQRELAALREEVGRLRAAINNAENGLIRTLHDQDSVVVDGWAWRQLFEAALAAKEEA